MFKEISEIAELIRYKFPIVQKYFGGIYRQTFTKYRTYRRNKLFRENAINVMRDFDSCMNKYSHPYCLIFGSLLGAVREKGFIKHDLDLDTAMWNDEYSPQIREDLSSIGFKLIHEYTVEDGQLGREETYEKNGVSIDIFYFYEAIEDYPYCCSFREFPGYSNMKISMKEKGSILATRVVIPFTHGKYVKMPFETLSLPCPENSIEILRYRYGEDFMTPKPKWNPRTNDTKHIIDWPEKVASFIDYT